MIPRITKLSDALGAEITGIDLRNPLTPDMIEMLNAALARFQLLCFRYQALAPLELANFSRCWGTLEVSDSLPLHPDVPEVSIILSEQNQMRKYGGVWHIEYGAHRVGAAQLILYAIDIPSEGGDTSFCNLAAAFDHLPTFIQREISGLFALRRVDSGLAKEYASPAFVLKMASDEFTVTHPVVRTHPVTARDVLYIDQGFTREIVGIDPERGRMLLDHLKAHSVRPEFIYRHQWRQGDVVIFDNRSLQHKAECDYEGQRRELHRCLVRETTQPFFLATHEDVSQIPYRESE